MFVSSFLYFLWFCFVCFLLTLPCILRSMPLWIWGYYTCLTIYIFCLITFCLNGILHWSCSFSCVYTVHIHVLLCTYTFVVFPFSLTSSPQLFPENTIKRKKDPTKHKNTTDNSKGIKREKSFSPGISHYFLEFLHCCFPRCSHTAICILSICVLCSRWIVPVTLFLLLLSLFTFSLKYQSQSIQFPRIYWKHEKILCALYATFLVSVIHNFNPSKNPRQQRNKSNKTKKERTTSLFKLLANSSKTCKIHTHTNTLLYMHISTCSFFIWNILYACVN